MPVVLKGGEGLPNEHKTLASSFYGFQGAGKTTVALTYPPPLFIYNCDRPMGHLLRKLPKHYDIVYEEALLDVDALTPSAAMKRLERFDALVKQALQHGRGSFILDGGDIFWDDVKLALIPRTKDDQPLPREWAEANAYMNHRLSRLVHSPLNLAMTAMARRVWAGATRETQMVEAEGFRHRGRWITTEIYMYVVEGRNIPFETPPPDSPAKGQTHAGYVSICKLNEQLVGMVIPSPSYRVLYRLIHGEPYPEEEKLWTPQ